MILLLIIMAFVSNSNLSKIDAGILPENACVIIIRTAWNASVVDELENGCKKILQQNGIKDIRVFTVPGVVEIPFSIRHYWDKHKSAVDRPMVFVALGCVIKGGTPHFDYVCQAVTTGIAQLNLELPVPSIFGILTVDDETQARDRIGGQHGHKGEEAGLSALKMLEFIERAK